MQKIICLTILWGLYICAVMTAGCKPDSLSPADYVQYIRKPDNGLIARQAYSGLTMEAFYQPPEYAALMQIPPAEMNDSLFRAEAESNKSFYRILFSIGSTSPAPIDEVLSQKLGANVLFEASKQRMLYQLQNAFTLFLGQDSLPCVFCHAQLSGKLSNTYDFILAFEADSASARQPLNKNIVLVYRDSIWLQQRFDFVFEKNNINQLPEIKI